MLEFVNFNLWHYIENSFHQATWQEFYGFFARERKGLFALALFADGAIA